MANFEGHIGHLEGIDSPWANAGGVVRTIEDVEHMAHTGVGWVEDGSHTLLGREGNGANGEIVYIHNPKTGETVNALGMPGKGIDIVEEEIPEKVRIIEAHNKKYVLNVAPVSEDPASETLELVTRAYQKGAHAVLVNAGCPNVVTEDGGRHEILSRNPEALEHTLSGLNLIVAKYAPVFIRVSPQETLEQAKQTYSVIKDSGVVSAVFVPNTWPGFIPLKAQGEPILQVPGGAGGKSGPAMAEEACLQTAWALEELKGSGVDVVSSSSIMNAQELKKRLGMGAVAGCGTTFYYESVNGWREDTGRLLAELAS